MDRLNANVETRENSATALAAHMLTPLFAQPSIAATPRFCYNLEGFQHFRRPC
jgi:hypothetical protein